MAVPMAVPMVGLLEATMVVQTVDLMAVQMDVHWVD